MAVPFSDLSAKARPGTTRHRLSKVPAITALFWAIKILTTGMGETASDFLAHTLGPLASVPLGFALFAVAMVLQLRATKYVAWRYWFAVAMVSVFGTMIADVAHVGLGIPYAFSTAFFAVVLAFVLYLWWAKEGTLSIHSITTKPRELYYWAAVVASFALGTAAGDLTAVTLGWGFLASSVVFAIAFAVPLIAGHFGVNEVLTFWAAYIITRPLGASIADWMGMPTDRGGLGWGTGLVSLIWAVGIAVLVTIVARTKNDIEWSTP